MAEHSKNILITGPPGSGKTTLVRNLAEALRSFSPAGFFTQELREHGARQGFGITGLDGTTGLLAHVSIAGRQRVGRYGVDVEGFDRFLRAHPALAPGNRLVIIDEVGKMECLSTFFREVVISLLDSSTPLVATIAGKGDAFIETVKQRPDADLVTLTERNRVELLGHLEERIRTLLGP
jgi:nucleoside-triphosphatase